MLGKIHQWQQQITLWLAGGRNSVTSLTVRQLWLDVKSWEDTVSCQSEKFTGDSVLDWQDKLADINRQVKLKWIICTFTLNNGCCVYA